LAFITAQDKGLAERTLKLIGNQTQTQFIIADNDGFDLNLSFLYCVFKIVCHLGKTRGIDPGRPGVPDYGRHIYNLSFQKQYLSNFNKWTLNSRTINTKETYAILAKANQGDISLVNDIKRKKLYEAFQDYQKLIRGTKYGAIVFDFDETLCESERKFIGPSNAVSSKLNELLDNDIVVGVASGRGKSLHKDLRTCIKKDHWNKIVIGLYNGSFISLLDSDTLPDPNEEVHNSLDKFHSNLLDYNFDLTVELRPNQISIQGCQAGSHEYHLVVELVKRFPELKFYASSHSMDIIPLEVSKNDVVDRVRLFLDDKNLEVLKIGDKGRLPGNDYELLSHGHSLSVDEVSMDFSSCWYFGDGQNRGIDTTLYYLNNISYFESYFKIKI
jgi:hydroxymethylpyrimidine pyrophosphatase-like HAD family hydrolase